MVSTAAHVLVVSAKLPVAKRIKIFHLTDLELQKTATRKVKRKLILESYDSRQFYALCWFKGISCY